MSPVTHRINIKFDTKPLNPYFDLMGIAFDKHLPLPIDEICKYKNVRELLAHVTNPKEQEHPRH